MRISFIKEKNKENIMKKLIIPALFIISLLTLSCEDPETAIFIDNPEFIPDSGIYQQAMFDNVKKILEEYDLSRFKGKRVQLDTDNNGLKATGKILHSLADIYMKENGIIRVQPDRSRRDIPPYKKGGEPEYEIFIDIIASGGHVSHNLLYDRYNSVVYIHFTEKNIATGEKLSKTTDSRSGKVFNILITLFCKVLYTIIVLSVSATVLMRFRRRIL